MSTVTFEEASRLLSISLAACYRWAKHGKFGPIRRSTYPTRISITAIECQTAPKG